MQAEGQIQDFLCLLQNFLLQNFGYNYFQQSFCPVRKSIASEKVESLIRQSALLAALSPLRCAASATRTALHSTFHPKLENAFSFVLSAHLYINIAGEKWRWRKISAVPEMCANISFLIVSWLFSPLTLFSTGHFFSVFQLHRNHVVLSLQISAKAYGPL